MNEKKGVLKNCSSFLKLEGAINIDTSRGFDEVVRELLSIDCLVVSENCIDPDISLLAFLARLLDKKVCWVGEEEPRGLISHLITKKGK